MNRRISLIIAWLCRVAIVMGLIAMLFFAFNLSQFAELARQQLPLPIQWSTVEVWQWGGLLMLSCLVLAVGLLALFFLQKAFTGIAKNQPFNLQNSANLRRFSLLLLAQILIKPVFDVLASVLLSFNHPAGQKILSITLGSRELSLFALALILWVVSDLLVEANRLQSENRQFV